jgi:peptidoglycan/LPS O-acetylase OafA/YrhL
MPSSPPADSDTGRIGAAALGAVLTGFAGWLAWQNLRRTQLDDWIFWAPVALWAFAMGLLCWWRALSDGRPTTRARIRASWRAGWVLGAIGLALGFVGPVLVMPKASLGPLLGILITGPGGFVLGALAAAVGWKDNEAAHSR